MLRQFRWIPAILLLVAGTYSARAEGPGIRLGDRLVLHPGIAAEFRYDSNIFFQPNNEVGGFMLRLMPTVDLATRPPQRGGNAPHKVDFRLHAGLDYREWLTSDPALSRYRMFGVQAGMLLTILPHYPFSIDLYDNYTRTSQPPYTRGDSNIDRDTNEVGIRFRYKPGGGRLELHLGYAFGIDFFEVSRLRDFNVMYHRVHLRLSWKFFPKTALYIEASEQPTIYPTPGMTAHPDSFPLRVTAGLIGLLTAKLSFHLWIGYGNGFYVSRDPMVPTPNPQTAIGGVELRWKPSMLSTGVIGYRHDFVNSLLGAYFDVDNAYISWSQLIWRFTALARLQYSNIRYQGIPVSAAVLNQTRTDNLLGFDFRVDYPFKDWLIASLGYTLQYNQTDATLATGPSLLVPLNYIKHEVFLRLSVLY